MTIRDGTATMPRKGVLALFAFIACALALVAGAVPAHAADATITVTDQVIRGGLALVKTDEDAAQNVPTTKHDKYKPQGDAAWDGTQVTVKSLNDQKVRVNGKDYTKNQVVLTLTGKWNDDHTKFEFTTDTDHDGVDRTLPYGLYLVEESKTNPTYGKDASYRQVFFVGKPIDQTKPESGDGVVQRASREYRDDGVYDWTSGDFREYPMAEPVIRGGLKGVKHDAKKQKAEPQGNATLAGAEITIFNDSQSEVMVDGKWYAHGEAVAKVMTADDGSYQTSPTLLPYGTYKLAETKPSRGYKLDTAWNPTVVVHPAANGDMTTAADKPVNEPEKVYGLKVAKIDAVADKGAAQGTATLAGAQLTIKNTSVKSVTVKGVEYAPGADIANSVMTTGEDGTATLDARLPTGTYEVRETKPSPGYNINATWRLNVEFTGDEDDGYVKDFTKDDASKLKEPVIMGGISVAKIDHDLREPGQAQGDGDFQGAEITIRNVSGKAVKVNGVTYADGADIPTVKLVTDKAGNASTGAAVLPFGKYELRETKAPDYYELNSEWRATVTIDQQGVVKPAQSNVDDKKQKFKVTITKKDGDGQPIAQGNASLANATFSVKNISDNAVVVGGKKYAKGDMLPNVKTNDKGIAYFREMADNGELPVGTYEVREVEAPKGYVKTDKVYTMVVRSKLVD